jgi:hypothetical protein
MKRRLITQAVNKSREGGLQCLSHLAPGSQGNQDLLKYLILAPLPSAESHVSGGSGVAAVRVTGSGVKRRETQHPKITVLLPASEGM